MKKEISYSKKLTLIYLQELFLNKTDETHFIRMPDILSYLEEREIFVDRRTIYSDITLLNHVGFEIEGVQEKGDYKYHHINRKFGTDELKVLVNAVASSKYLTESKSRELIGKIKSLGSSFDTSVLNRNVLLGNRIKSMNDKVLKNLDTIYIAINENCQLSFQYMRWNVKKELENTQKGDKVIVSPFAVTLSDNNYYMIAYNHKFNSLRHYRIDKMKNIVPLHETREGQEHFKSFDITDYTYKTFGMFRGEERTLSLQCKNHLAGVFIDRFGKDVYMRDDVKNPNYFIVRITVYTSPQFYAWLFGLGKDVTIISPEAAIEEFTSMTEEILSKYDRK